MKLFSLRSLTALIAVTAPLAAQGMLPYLPKQTLMAMSAPKLSAAISEMQQTPLAKMWAEEEVQAFVGDLVEMFTEQREEGLGQMREMYDAGMLPFDPDKLSELGLEGFTLAVTSVAMTEGDFGPMPRVGTMIHLDFGDAAEMIYPILQMGLGALQQEAPVELSETMIGDLRLQTLTPSIVGAPDMSINVANVPNGVVIGTITDEVKAVLNNWINKTPALTQTPGFAAATKGSADAAVRMYMAPDFGIDFFMNTMKMMMEQGPSIPLEGGEVDFDADMLDFDGVQRAMKAMGMSDVGTFGISMGYENGKAVSRARHAYANAAGATTSASKVVDTKFLRWVPKDAVSFSAGSMDVAWIYDTIVKGMQAYDADMAQMMLGQLAMMEEQIGFSIRKDLFGAMGDHYITWSMPMGTISAAPEMAFLLKVNDEQKLLGALQSIAAMSDGALEIEEATKRGLKSYQILLNADPMDGMGMNPFDMFQPTFAFKDGYMVMGFSASDVKRVFKRMSRDDNPKGDIRSNKEFMAIADQIPSSINALSFVDWKANFESYYQMLTGLLAFVPMSDEIPVDMSMIPDSETLTQHLFASLSYRKVGADGAETVTISPFGMETVGVVGGLIGAGAMMFGSMSEGF